IAFPNPVEVHEGETYWIVFKINEAYSNFEWGYAYKNEGINTTFHMPTNWNDQFPDQLNQSQMTYYNRTVTIVGVESKLVIRGLGVDIYPPNCISKGSERIGSQVKFYARWHEDIQLKNATFYWNFTGVMQENGTVELSGVYAWSNFTRNITDNPPDFIAWYIVCSDTAGNLGNTSVQIIDLRITTELNVGWNTVNATSVDVGHSLSEINASLNKDNINWTMLVLEYPNGTQYVFVYGYTLNVNVQVTGTDNILYIYCGEAGIWYHKYD
ncbi:MAG: hypothetical protein DRP09_14735, partial [Candidatus Thorarchaeota archaeon]